MNKNGATSAPENGTQWSKNLSQPFGSHEGNQCHEMHFKAFNALLYYINTTTFKTVKTSKCSEFKKNTFNWNSVCRVLAIEDLSLFRIQFTEDPNHWGLI